MLLNKNTHYKFTDMQCVLKFLVSCVLCSVSNGIHADLNVSVIEYCIYNLVCTLLKPWNLRNTLQFLQYSSSFLYDNNETL